MKQRLLLEHSRCNIIIDLTADGDEILSRESHINFNNFIKSLKNNLGLEYVYFLYDKQHLINISYLIDSFVFLNVLLSQRCYYFELYLSNIESSIPVYRRIEDVTIFQDSANGWLLPLSIKSNELLYYGNADYEVLANNNFKPQVLLLQGKILQTVTETDLTSLNSIFSAPFAPDIYYKDNSNQLVKITKVTDDKIPLPNKMLYVFTSELFRYILAYTQVSSVNSFDINYGIDTGAAAGLLNSLEKYPLEAGLNLIDIGATIATQFDNSTDFNRSGEILMIDGFPLMSENEDLYTIIPKAEHGTVNNPHTWKQVIFITTSTNICRASVGSINGSFTNFWDHVWDSRGAFDNYINDLSQNPYSIQAQVTQGANLFKPISISSSIPYSPLSSRTFMFARSYSTFGGYPQSDSLLGFTPFDKSSFSIDGYTVSGYSNQETFEGSIGSFNNAHFKFFSGGSQLTSSVFDTWSSNPSSFTRLFNDVHSPLANKSFYTITPTLAGNPSTPLTWRYKHNNMSGSVPISETFLSLRRYRRNIDKPQSDVDNGWYLKEDITVDEAILIDPFTKIIAMKNTIKFAVQFFNDLISSQERPMVPFCNSFYLSGNYFFDEYGQFSAAKQKTMDELKEIFFTKMEELAFFGDLGQCFNCDRSGFRTTIYTKTWRDGSPMLCSICGIKNTYLYNFVISSLSKISLLIDSFFVGSLGVVYNHYDTNDVISYTGQRFRQRFSKDYAGPKPARQKKNFVIPMAFGITKEQIEEYFFEQPLFFFANIKCGEVNGVEKPLEFFWEDFSLRLFNNFKCIKMLTQPPTWQYDSLLFTSTHHYGYTGLSKKGTTSSYIKSGSTIIDYDLSPYYKGTEFVWQLVYTPEVRSDWLSFVYTTPGIYHTLQYCENDVFTGPTRSNTGQFWVSLTNSYYMPVYEGLFDWVETEWIPIGEPFQLKDLFDPDILNARQFIRVYYKIKIEIPKPFTATSTEPTTNWFGYTAFTNAQMITEMCRRLRVVCHTQNYSGLQNRKIINYNNYNPIDSKLPLLLTHKHQIYHWVNRNLSPKWDDYEFGWFATTSFARAFFSYGHPIPYANYNDILFFSRIFFDISGVIQGLVSNYNTFDTSIDTWNDIVLRIQDGRQIGSITSTNLSNVAHSTWINVYTPVTIPQYITAWLQFSRRPDSQNNTNMLTMLRTAKWLLNDTVTNDVVVYNWLVKNITIKAPVSLRDSLVNDKFLKPSITIDNTNGNLTCVFLAKEYLVGNKLVVKDDETSNNISFKKGDYWLLKHPMVNADRRFLSYDLLSYNYASEGGVFWDGIYQKTMEETTLNMSYVYSNVSGISREKMLTYEPTPLIDALFIDSGFLDWEMHIDLGRSATRFVILEDFFDLVPFNKIPQLGLVWENRNNIRLNYSDDYDYYVEIVYPVQRQYDCTIWSDSTNTFGLPTLCYFNSQINTQIVFRVENIQSLSKLYVKAPDSNFKIVIHVV